MARAPRRTGSAVTMEMVARQAGVSAMTVSNVINGRRVNDETRRVVLEAIRALNYTPNLAAQALASARAIRIGLFYPNVHNAFLSSVLLGALNATTRCGAQLLVRNFDHDGIGSILEAINGLIDSGANALLMPPPLCERVNASGVAGAITVPVMALSPGSDLSDLSSVRIDDYAAARDMTRYLVGLGHRRIGFVRAAKTHIVWRTRMEGYLAGLAEAGIPARPAYVAEGDLSFESGLAAAEVLLNLVEPPTAIFASNDDMAAAVISFALRQGLRLPDDLSVAGFDDSPLATKLWPTLTTIHQPIFEIADLATQALIKALLDPVAPARNIGASHVEFTLIERGSTSPPC